MNFARRIALGFVVVTGVIVLQGWVAMRSASEMGSAAARETQSHQALRLLADLRSSVAEAEAAQRGYMVTKDATYTAGMSQFIGKAQESLRSMQSAPAWASSQPEITELARRVQALFTLFEERIGDRQRMTLDEVVRSPTGNAVREHMQQLRERFVELEGVQDDQLDERTAAMAQTLGSVRAIALSGSLAAVAIALLTAWTLHSQLRSLVGASAVELSRRARDLEQAAKRQASSSSELLETAEQLTTTMHELQVSATQIAQRASDVQVLAESGTGAAKAGALAMDQARVASVQMNHRIDQIVDQMTLLSAKVQGAASIVNSIEELAERANILSINATVEAYAISGEGARFIAVAEEIRRLAERVRKEATDSATQLAIVRDVSNATIMSTETGAKAVASSAASFASVEVRFAQILQKIAQSQEASEEIRLATQQQTSAGRLIEHALLKLHKSSTESEQLARQSLTVSGELSQMAQAFSRSVASSAQRLRHGPSTGLASGPA